DPFDPAPVAYVANGSDGTVSVVNIVQRKVDATVIVGPGPVNLAVLPDDSAVYVARALTAGIVTVIDVIKNGMMTTYMTTSIPVGQIAFGVAITPDGTRAYVANAGSGSNTGSFSVIDTATKMTMPPTPIALNGNPQAVAIVVITTTTPTPTPTPTIIPSATA